MKRGSKWEANVHHHAYLAEAAFLRGDTKVRERHLVSLARLTPETHEDQRAMMRIIERATKRAHEDARR